MNREEAKAILVDEYKMPEVIAEDCIASRNDEDIRKIIDFLKRYGTMIEMPYKRYGKRI